MNRSVSGHFALGVFLLFAGVLSLLNNLNIIRIPSLWGLLWPALIIWVGFNMLRRDRTPVTSGISVDSDAMLNISAVLGGADHRSGGKEFGGGNVTAFLGGVKMDLRDAKMTQNEATVDVLAVMGGIELLVPPDWIVDSRVTPLLGGYEDKTRAPKDSAKKLIVRGTVVMGGIEVKS